MQHPGWHRHKERDLGAALAHADKLSATASLHCVARTAQGENSARPRCVSCATSTPSMVPRSDAAPSTSAAAASGQLSWPVCAVTKGTRSTPSACLNPNRSKGSVGVRLYLPGTER